MPLRSLVPVVLALALSSAAPAAGDAILVTKAMKASTIAEIFVEDSGVRVELEIGLDDAEAFAHLLPDEIWARLGREPEPWEKRLARFFGQDLVVRLDGGPPSAGRLESLETRDRLPRDELTGAPMAVTDAVSETVIHAIVSYPFDTRPAALSIRPPRHPSGAVVDLGFMTYHRGLPVTDFRYLGAEETLDLDWTDPWYSAYRNPNLRRQYDAPMNVFLYVEPFEVRTEVIVRPVDLQHWLDLGVDAAGTIPAEAQTELRERASEFVGRHHGVTVDGTPRELELDRVHFLRRTLRSSTVIDPPEDIEAISATLGVIFVTPTPGLPEEVTLTWDLFSPRVRAVPAAATDEAGPMPYLLEPGDNVLRWQNFLRNATVPSLVEIARPPAHRRFLNVVGGLALLPLAWLGVRLVARARGGRRPAAGPVTLAVALAVVAVAALGGARAPRVDEESARGLVRGLLTNVYRAFDFREESAIYDALERSVAGDLLTQTYLETRRGLELASQGGARAKVRALELQEMDARDLRGEVGFEARCTWDVTGAVGHWGHVHRRKNRYEARLVVRPIDGAWRITELELLQEERI